MDKVRPQWVGAPCGRHGPNTFYKECKFEKNGKWRILSVGDFFFVKTCEAGPLGVAELQLLWQDDKATNGGGGLMLSSSKLYFLPEDTPKGRAARHGEDEVISVNGKAIMRLEDLIGWMCPDVPWMHGTPAIYRKDNRPADGEQRDSTQVELFARNSGLDIGDVGQDKHEIDDEDELLDRILIISYPNYCRYCTALKRIEHIQDAWISNELVKSLGAFTVPQRNVHIMFCREEFDHPTLGENELLCDHLAPNMKGRPRKKKLSVRSNSNEDLVSESSNDSTEHSQVNEEEPCAEQHYKKHSHKKLQGGKYRTKMVNGKVKTEMKRVRPKDEATFLAGLFKFMKDRNSPIFRVPNLGFKQIDLFLLYTMGQKFGGYEAITSRRLWKKLYDALGGSVGSTSAATCTRRHYERLILPYERHLHQQEHKPLPNHHAKSPSEWASLKGYADGKPVKSKKSPSSSSSAVKRDPGADKDSLSFKQRMKDMQIAHAAARLAVRMEYTKTMTKAEETWRRDMQKKAAAASYDAKAAPHDQQAAMPPTSQDVVMIQAQCDKPVPDPDPALCPSAVAQPVVPATLTAVPVRELSCLLQDPVCTQLLPPEATPVVKEELSVPSLKIKLKVKKAKSKHRKRPRVLKDQLRELEEQRRIQRANNQIYRGALQVMSPPVARKKTMSIADILYHQANMKAASQQAPSDTVPTLPAGITTTSPSVTTSSTIVPSTSSSTSYQGQPIIIKADPGMPAGSMFFTLPLHGRATAGVNAEMALDGEAASSTAGLALVSNMATVVHVGQPMQVMQMPSSVDKNVPHSLQCLPSLTRMDAMYTTASVANSSLSYSYNMGTQTSVATAAVPLTSVESQSPVHGRTSMDSSETVSPRPSVIQHTQHVQSRDHGVPVPPYRHAIQASDLILRNLSSHGMSGVEPPGTHTVSSHVGQKLSDLPKDAMVVTPRMVSPFMAYIPVPVVVSSGQPGHTEEGPKGVDASGVDTASKRRRTESGKENVSRPLSPHGFSVNRLGKVTPLPLTSPGFPVPDGPMPVQDEPCDLSLPKHSRVKEETPNARLEFASHTKHRSSSKKRSRELAKDRIDNLRELGLAHEVGTSASSFSLASHVVKMTPNPRGSIMQGVIDPKATSPPSTLCKDPTLFKHKDLHPRDTPSRQSTSSSETTPSPHPAPFPYFPHPGMPILPSNATDKPMLPSFVFPDFQPMAMMGYPPPRLIPPHFVPTQLLSRPDLIPTSLPLGIQPTTEQLMRRDMFFPQLPFPVRHPFLGSPSLSREGQHQYIHPN